MNLRETSRRPKVAQVDLCTIHATGGPFRAPRIIDQKGIEWATKNSPASFLTAPGLPGVSQMKTISALTVIICSKYWEVLGVPTYLTVFNKKCTAYHFPYHIHRIPWFFFEFLGFPQEVCCILLVFNNCVVFCWLKLLQVMGITMEFLMIHWDSVRFS